MAGREASPPSIRAPAWRNPQGPMLSRRGSARRGKVMPRSRAVSRTASSSSLLMAMTVAFAFRKLSR